MRERRENRMKRAVREAGAWALAAALTLTAVLVPADTLQAAGSGQSSYRGSGDNMAILTDARTVANLPKSLEETEVKWTVQVADDPSDWTNAITSPVEVDGTIYVLSNGRLKAFDAVTGKLAKAASDEDLINNYYNYYLMGGKVNGETMLFVESQNIVAAYNSDLEQVWKTRSEDVAYGNDGYAPMYLSDGVIYGLTTSYSGSSAGAFAIDAVSGAYLWQTEVPFTAAGQGSWAMGGGYSGMVAAGDYVICGTEGGTVYVFAKSNGGSGQPAGCLGGSYAKYPGSDRLHRGKSVVYHDGRQHLAGRFLRIRRRSGSGLLGKNHAYGHELHRNTGSLQRKSLCGMHRHRRVRQCAGSSRCAGCLHACDDLRDSGGKTGQRMVQQVHGCGDCSRYFHRYRLRLRGLL